MIGRRGLVFSLMAFLLLSSLLALKITGEQNQAAVGKGLTESYAFRKVSDKYSNISKNLVDLTGNDAEKAVDARILPLAYSIDGNSITVSSEIPVVGERVQNYLETLNAFRIFLEDTDYGNEFDSMRVDINTLTPVVWGGSDANASFIAQPQCMRYDMTDSNAVFLRFPCSTTAYQGMRRIDINVSMSLLHDFNSLSCSFGGSPTCPDSDYNALDSLPYISITFLDGNCSKCAITQKTVRGHYNPLAGNWVSLRCSGAFCVSQPLDINFSESTGMSHRGIKVDVAARLGFTSEVESFSFGDANILVADDYFGAARWLG